MVIFKSQWNGNSDWNALSKNKKCRAGSVLQCWVDFGTWSLYSKNIANLWSIMEAQSLSRLNYWEFWHTSAERNVLFSLEVQDLWALWEHYEVQKKHTRMSRSQKYFNIHLLNIMAVFSFHADSKFCISFRCKWQI